MKNKIDKIVIAIPQLENNTKKKIIRKLKYFKIPLYEMPSIDKISYTSIGIPDLVPIKIDDILGREQILTNLKSVKKSIYNKVICVTGAGGSIGSELCRQIIKLKPSKLLLIEMSEPSLYYIQEEILNLKSNQIQFEFILGNVNDKLFLERIFDIHNINIIFHAAAYKHVPLVELNPLAGINNNVFSTFNVCKIARDKGIDQVTLISTDKAVRPTNIMGASKRLAELVVQAFAEESKLDKSLKKRTCFSIVRFGNVLGSSGSVVPKFKDQIAKGGPITVTHPEIVRYFMTIKEAAQLVIQTTILAKGGEVFLLDMGEAIKIKDLAEQMILLSGLSIKDKQNPEGEIEIVFTGIRPGEKLYEELLIDAKAEATKEKLIFKASERGITYKELFPLLTDIKNAIRSQDKDKCLLLMSKIISEWKYNKETLNNFN